MPVVETEEALRRELEELRASVRQMKENADGLEREATRYRLLIAHLNLGTFVSSMDGQMLECNDRTLEMSGETRSSLLARPLSSYYENPTDREHLVKELRDTGAVHNFETWTREIPSALRWFGWHLTA